MIEIIRVIIGIMSIIDHFLMILADKIALS